MGTYCDNADLVLDNGQSIEYFLADNLTTAQKVDIKAKARERAFNYINANYLEGKTAVPAYHIPALKQIEIDLAIANIMSGAFTNQSLNTSNWIKEFKDRAEVQLKNLKYRASVQDIIPDDENTGNGYVTEIKTNDEYTRTETWILRAMNAAQFSVFGSITGYLREATIDTIYPERDWYGSFKDYGLITGGRYRFEQYPISFKIISGATDFVQDDKFIFRAFSSSSFRTLDGKIIRG